MSNSEDHKIEHNLDEKLDSTQVNIDQQYKRDPTVTEIKTHIKNDEDNFVSEITDKSKKNFFNFSFLSFFPNLFKKITSKKNKISQKIKKTKVGKKIDSSNEKSQVDDFIAPSELILENQTKFYMMRFFAFASGLIFNGIFVYLLIQSIENYHPHQWVVWVFCGLALLLSIVSLILRWPLGWFSAIPTILFFGLLTYHRFFFQSNDSHFITFFGYTVADISNIVFLYFLILQTLIILFIYPRWILAKIILIPLALYGCLGFGLNILENVNLESSWNGVSFLTQLPLFAFQPVFVTMHFFIPLYWCFTLVSSFFRKKVIQPDWIFVNLILLLVVGGFSLKIFLENRVPNVLSSIIPMNLGEGQSTLVLENGNVLSLKTKNFDEKSDKDTVERYRIKLALASPLKNNQAEFYVDVTRASGSPVSFLLKRDFDLTLNNQPLSQWSFLINPDFKPGRKNQSHPYFIKVVLLDSVLNNKDKENISSQKIEPLQFDKEILSAEKMVESNQFDFIHPSFGEYLKDQTLVGFNLEKDWGPLDLYLNNQKIQVLKYPYQTVLDTTQWPSGWYSLKAKIKNENGEELSKSLLLQTGESIVDVHLSSQTPKKESLYYNNIIFILDASISQWDSLGEKSKWEWQRDLFNDQTIAAKFNGINAGVIVQGAKSPFEMKNCQDILWAHQLGKFNVKRLQSVLKQVGPQGVSSLFYSLEKTLMKRPEKIVLISDGADTCLKTIPASLNKQLKEFKGELEIFSLGEMTTSEKQTLNQIAETARGKFFQIDNYEAFYQQVANSLSINWRLINEKGIAYSFPVNAKPQKVRPGVYKLEINITPPFKPKEIVIKNALTTEVILNQKDKETTSQEKYFAR